MRMSKCAALVTFGVVITGAAVLVLTAGAAASAGAHHDAGKCYR